MLGLLEVSPFKYYLTCCEFIKIQKKISFVDKNPSIIKRFPW